MRFIRSSRESRGAKAARLSRPTRSAVICQSEPLESRTLFAAHFYDAGAMMARFASMVTAPAAPAAQVMPQSEVRTLPKAPAPLIGSSSMRRMGDEDGCIARARTANPNFTREGMLSYEMDVDLYKVSVNQGQRITIDIDNPSWSNVDAMLRVFDAAGNEVARNNNAAGPGETLGTEAYIDITFPTTNTYYIGVSGSLNDSYNPAGGFGDKLGGSKGDYTLRIRNYVDPDGSDQIMQARAIADGTWSGSISHNAVAGAGDVVGATGAYSLDTKRVTLQ